MRLSILAVLLATGALGPVTAQQAAPSPNAQGEADKGIITKNSGAAGYVSEQDKASSAAHALAAHFLR